MLFFILFTRAGVSDDADLLLGFDGEGDALEGRGQGVVVAHAVLVEGDGALARPVTGHLAARAGDRTLRLKILQQGGKLKLFYLLLKAYVAQSTTQGHLRAFNKFKYRTS